MQLYDIYKQHPRIFTDTRKPVKDSIFFALKGGNFDGNQYAAQALEQGALYAVIDNPEFKKDERYILVDDTLASLQALAKEHRLNLNVKVIVIAGSNGKTTTKELLARVLAKKYNTFSTPGNFNNHIGVPLTILSIPKETEMAVIEIGANHETENAFLCEIAHPDYGVVTNCGKDHLEGFGSIEGVIRSNKEVYDYLGEKKRIAFVNADDETLMSISWDVERILYAKDNKDIANNGVIVEKFPYLKAIINGTLIESKLFGSFQLYNMLVAYSVGHHFKIEPSKIKEAIEEYIPSNNRSQFIEWKGNNVLLDAYNANPSSMMEMLKDFDELPMKNKVAILGDMFELGEESEKEHQYIVDFIENSSIDKVLLVGSVFSNHKPGSRGLFFEKTAEAKEWIDQKGLKDALIMVKGSRGMALEKIFS